MKWKDTTYYILTPARSGPRISASADQITASLDVLVDGTPSAVRRAFADFLGTCEIKTEGGTRYYSRSIPFYLPGFLRDDPGHERLPYVVCTGVSDVENYKPQGHELDDTGEALPDFLLAKLTLSFTSVRYKVRPDGAEQMIANLGGLPDEGTLERFVTRVRKPTNRTITAPPGAWRRVVPAASLGLETVNVPVAFGVPVQEAGNEVIYIQHGLPEIPTARIRKAVGAINLTAFDGHPAGTLRCEPPEVEPGIQPDGRYRYDIRWRFAQMDRVARTSTGGATQNVTTYGHNYLLLYFVSDGDQILDYRVGASDVNPLTGAATANAVKMHREVEMRDIFNPDPP